MALERVAKEHAYLQRDPLPTCFASPASIDTPLHWIGHITGPPDTPYAQQTFPIAIDFPEEYPMRPFKLTFTTPVSHPSVSDEGKVRLAELEEKNWSPVLTVRSVLICLQELLSDMELHEEVVNSEAKKTSLESKHTKPDDSGTSTATRQVEPTHRGRKIGGKKYAMDMRKPEFAMYEQLPEAEKDAFLVLHADIVRDA